MPRSRLADGLAAALLILGASAVPSPSLAQSPPTIAQATTLALTVLPWDGNGAWEAICTEQRPCDSIWVDPRISRLTTNAIIFVQPGRDSILDTLREIPAILGHAHPSALKEWNTCSEVFVAAAETRPACVAIGLLALRSHPPDSLLFAAYLLAPATSNAWSVIAVLTDSSGTTAVVRGHGTP